MHSSDSIEKGTSTSSFGPDNTLSKAQSGMQVQMQVVAQQRPYPLSWIPTQTAMAMHSELLRHPAFVRHTNEAGVMGVLKIVGNLEDCHEEQLTPYDWSLLQQAWTAAGLPPFKMPIAEAEFRQYEQAFESYMPTRPFRLSPQVLPIVSRINSLLSNTVAAHQAELIRQIETGHLLAHDVDTQIPTSNRWSENGGLRLDELAKFAQSLSIELKVVSRSESLQNEADRIRQERKELLREFRAFGGNVDPDTEEFSPRGMLSRFAKLRGVKRQSIQPRLLKAAAEESKEPVSKNSTPAEDSKETVSSFNWRRPA